jgi:hypothetical protein
MTGPAGKTSPVAGRYLQIRVLTYRPPENKLAFSQATYPMNLRSTTLVCACVLALLLQGCGQTPPAASSASPATPAAAALAAAPALQTDAVAKGPSFQDLTGKAVTLADYAGKKVFVNFWATWCAPCIREIPSIGRAAATLASENYVFLLASDESADTIKNFLLDRSFTGNFVKLDNFVGSLGVEVMPTSVLYDEHGTVVRSWQGANEWDSAAMLAQIRGQ